MSVFAVKRFGRTQRFVAILTATKTKKTVAIAGRVLRMNKPMVTPSTNANAAYPIGTMCAGRKYRRRRANWSNGLDHQETTVEQAATAC